jgi:hypothetical protein
MADRSYEPSRAFPTDPTLDAVDRSSVVASDVEKPAIALVEGSGPQLSGETTSVLQARLRVAALTLSLGFGIFLVYHITQVRWSVPSEYSFAVSRSVDVRPCRVRIVILPQKVPVFSWRTQRQRDSDLWSARVVFHLRSLAAIVRVLRARRAFAQPGRPVADAALYVCAFHTQHLEARSRSDWADGISTDRDDRADVAEILSRYGVG